MMFDRPREDTRSKRFLALPISRMAMKSAQSLNLRQFVARTRGALHRTTPSDGANLRDRWQRRSPWNGAEDFQGARNAFWDDAAYACGPVWLHVPVDAAPDTDYFDGREPVKRQSVDVFAGELAHVRRGRPNPGTACESEGHKNDDCTMGAHTRKRSTLKPSAGGAARVQGPYALPLELDCVVPAARINT